MSNPFGRQSAYDRDVVAEALRYENVQMNGHGHRADPWDDLEQRFRDLWLRKADRVIAAIAAVRRGRGLA